MKTWTCGRFYVVCTQMEGLMGPKPSEFGFPSQYSQLSIREEQCAVVSNEHVALVSLTCMPFPFEMAYLGLPL